ncbi:MAG: chain-length determining protein [Alphaproteobacteria bacterium]|jgi:polysaccharide biosynthesis protein PslE|nr:chain-length determining protein [Alphaproteobacteria bacterium]MBU2041557.1 chain-length determining protein [Alphaproteobacteria bacterium]MBU2125796.1 chain-length determining protein [Alphaproteobacteria bacterium]MBU2290072.1 chain-length determining protein [Alphaproteobacteria bacterium]MBU2397724.1 chain-length determining protein [Alphaproteobacteria bacterium]
MRTTAYTTVRPRYGFLDVVGLLFRETLLMILIFLAVFAIGTALVLTLKKSYTATASVYAGAGQEYVYRSRVGAIDPSQPLEADAVAGAEAQILGSLTVKRRAIRAVGADTVLGPGASGTPAEKETAALKALDAGLGVGVTPGSAIIAVSYESDDPVRAAQVLNAVIDQYLVRRRQVFQGSATPAYAAQREAFEDDLNTADAAYNAFLASNDIGDFATAKASLAANYQTTQAEALSLRAQLNQATQRLSTLEAQLSQQPAEVVLQQDLNISAQDQILTLRTQREALLSRYTPEAQPVRDLDQQIADLQAYVATGTTVGPKEVRTGPSAIFTEIETARITAAADRDGLAARLAVAEGQLNQLRARLAELTRLESTNANLAGNREVLTTLVRDFQQRESAARADSALVAAGADNVNVIERAEAPTRGTSLKAPLLAVVFLFAAFTALCVGLLRVFTRRGYATPASTGRTLDMPVLAVAPMKAR